MLLSGCSVDPDSARREKDIIYKVGAFEATRYEVDQDFLNFKAGHSGTNDHLMDSWMNALRTKAYFLADAYAKRYDTLSVLQKKLDFAIKYKIAQEGGYLWNRNVAPKLKVSNAEVEDAYRKRADLYHIDLLFFSDERILRDAGKRFSVDSPKMFYELVKEYRGHAGVEFASVSMVYPFTQLASVKDIINQKNIGSVLGPIAEPEGSYFILLTGKQKRDLPSIETDRQHIEQDLIFLKRKMAIHAKQDSIFRTSSVVFRDDNIERLARQLTNKVTSAPDTDTLTLMRYHLNDAEVRFRAKDYQEFIKYSPILVGDFSQQQQIRDNLKDQLIRAYLHEEAKRLGVLADETLLLEKRHYYHALLEQYYYVEEFERNIQISPEELVDYYNKNPKDFPADQIAWVSFIEFANEHAAYNGISYFQSVLSRGNTPSLSDTATVHGVIHIKAPAQINGTTSEWGEQNRKQFIDGKVNIVYGPIKHNNRVYLYYISRKETENVKEFSTVKEKIRARLKRVRVEELKTNKISALKKQFNEDDKGLKAYCEGKKVAH